MFVSNRLKVIGSVGGVVLVIIVVALLIGGIGGAGSPEQTVSSFYREAERLNASKMLELFVEESRYLWSGMKWTFAEIDSLSLSSLAVEVALHTEGTAMATAKYDLTLKLKDGSVGSQTGVVDHFSLRRVGNRWLIVGTDFLSGD